jgi:non-specific serine/threonine protein kinase
MRYCARTLLNTEPDPETTALFQRIRDRVQLHAKKPVVRRTSQGEPLSFRLPKPITALIGRNSELWEIKARARASRLVTLTGTGGVGKTRLAIQAAEELAEEYADGACFVALAALEDPGLVPQAVATALDIREEPGRPLSVTIAGHLQAADLLLVLDNCEHLLQPCAHLAHALLQSCHGLRILTTSRQPLGITGEVTWRVSSLSVPSPSEEWERPRLDGGERDKDRLSQALEYGSVQLFAERASGVQQSFSLNQQNLGAVVRICRRLDGIPLAIEMAAAQMRAMSAEQIAIRLSDQFSLLRDGSSTDLPRQQTLLATMDWSYALLATPEQRLLQRLSVFAGGWTLEAAEEICSGDGVQQEEMPAHLTSLVEKSVVDYETQGGQARYRLLETVRQYAHDRLAECRQTDRWRGRHLDYFLALAGAAEAARTSPFAPYPPHWMERLELEHNNMRAALSFSSEFSEPSSGVAAPALEASLRLCGALWQFWAFRGYLEEGRSWCRQVLNKSGTASPRLCARVHLGMAFLTWNQSDYAAMGRASRESLALSRAAQDEETTALTLALLGVSVMRDDRATARKRVREGLRIARRVGARWITNFALHVLGGLSLGKAMWIALPFLSRRVWRSRGNVKMGWGSPITLVSWPRLNRQRVALRAPTPDTGRRSCSLRSGRSGEESPTACSAWPGLPRNAGNTCALSGS